MKIFKIQTKSLFLTKDLHQQIVANVFIKLQSNLINSKPSELRVLFRTIIISNYMELCIKYIAPKIIIISVFF